MKIAYLGYPHSIHDAKWINRLSKKHEVIMITDKFEREKSLLSKDIPVYVILDSTYSSFARKRNHEIITDIRKVIRQHKVDIIHTLYAFPNAMWASKVGLPHMITTRGSDVLVQYPIIQNPSNLKQRLTFFFLRRDYHKAFQKAFAITGTSIKQSAVNAKLRGTHDGVHLIRTGIPLDKLIPDNDYNLSETLRIFFPRRMGAVYNHDFLIDCLIQLKTEHPQFKYIVSFINDAPKSAYAKRIVDRVTNAELNENVRWLEDLSQEKIFNEYKSSDVIVSIPLSDGTPNSCLEAMALKKPVLMSPLDYDPEIFNNQTVDIIDPLTVKGLNNYLVKFATQENFNIRKKKLENAYSVVHNLVNIDVALAQIEELYRNALKQ